MKDECQGFVLSKGMCKGNVEQYEKRAKSFGQPFVTHAMLCEAHAEALGFAMVKG